MRICIPDQAWRQVCEAIKKKTKPADPFLRKVYSVMKGKEEHQSVAEALDLIENISHRISVTAYFLSGADIEQISRSLLISPDTLTVFGKLCIDTSVFRNKLEWNDYVVSYVKHYCADNERLKKEVQCAVTIGPIALEKYWQRGNEKLAITDKDLTRKVLETALEKAVLAVGSSINSNESREALKWGRFAVSIAPVHNNMKDTQELEDGAWAVIEKRREAKRPQDTDIGEVDNILH